MRSSNLRLSKTKLYCCLSFRSAGDSCSAAAAGGLAEENLIGVDDTNAVFLAADGLAGESLDGISGLVSDSDADADELIVTFTNDGFLTEALEDLSSSNSLSGLSLPGIPGQFKHLNNFQNLLDLRQPFCSLNCKLTRSISSTRSEPKIIFCVFKELPVVTVLVKKTYQ